MHGQQLERIALSTLKADNESNGVEKGGMTRIARCQRIRLGGESGQHPHLKLQGPRKAIVFHMFPPNDASK
jgi:hypothetical protein